MGGGRGFVVPCLVHQFKVGTPVAATSRGCLWRTVLTALVAIDYFLFTTGYPSLTYSLLGGWFIVPLLVATAIGVSYGIASIRSAEGRRAFGVYAIVTVVVIGVLLSLSGAARRGAAASLEADALGFVSDPTTTAVQASTQARALMADIKKYPFTVHREAFIPTFRRMDLVVHSEQRGAFTLVLTMSWNGVPEIALLAQAA
jgi:hypothetical protein